MAKNNARLEDPSVLIQAGIDPKTGLPTRMSGGSCNIISNINIEKGLSFTLSNIFLLSLYPTYPAGEPISLLIVCASLYSLISSFIILFDSFDANDFAKTVFPTPLGPVNIIE